MKLTERYRRLTIWNKLGACGALASIIGLVVTVVFMAVDEEQRSPRNATPAEANSSYAKLPFAGAGAEEIEYINSHEPEALDEDDRLWVALPSEGEHCTGDVNFMGIRRGIDYFCIYRDENYDLTLVLVRPQFEHVFRRTLVADFASASYRQLFAGYESALVLEIGAGRYLTLLVLMWSPQYQRYLQLTHWMEDDLWFGGLTFIDLNADGWQGIVIRKRASFLEYVTRIHIFHPDRLEFLELADSDPRGDGLWEALLAACETDPEIDGCPREYFDG